MNEELSNDSRVLAGSIGEFFRNRNAARDAKTPLEKPAILSDPKADPTKRAEAEQQYAEALLGRKTLTNDEQVFLGSEISKYLKEGH